jgi:ribosomal protein S18 acetylase RimI-like enzyme
MRKVHTNHFLERPCIILIATTILLSLPWLSSSFSLSTRVFLPSPRSSSTSSRTTTRPNHQQWNIPDLQQRYHSFILFAENVPIRNDPLTHQDNLDLRLPDGICIRNATEKDLKSASKILTDAFFSLNFFTMPLEWLTTYLSLCDTFPETGDKYYMLVAYQREQPSLVVGICEVDCRITANTNAAPRPYICNLAIDTNWRRKGIAKAFIKICEDKARNEWKKNVLHLRVRRNDAVALNMYRSLGYALEDVEQPLMNKAGEIIVLLKKSFVGND